jgi:hypothetical protein
VCLGEAAPALIVELGHCDEADVLWETQRIGTVGQEAAVAGSHHHRFDRLVHRYAVSFSGGRDR